MRHHYVYGHQYWQPGREAKLWPVLAWLPAKFTVTGALALQCKVMLQGTRMTKTSNWQPSISRGWMKMWDWFCYWHWQTHKGIVGVVSSWRTIKWTPIENQEMILNELHSLNARKHFKRILLYDALNFIYIILSFLPEADWSVDCDHVPMWEHSLLTLHVHFTDQQNEGESKTCVPPFIPLLTFFSIFGVRSISLTPFSGHAHLSAH